MSNTFHVIDPKSKSPEKDSSVIDNVIGQEEAKNKLKFFVDSHCAEDPFPTILLTGSHGLGKSFLAKKTAEALGRKLIEINSNTYENPNKFIENVLIKQMVGSQEITLLLDEAHALSDGVTNVLLTLLNPSDSHYNYENYKGSKFIYDMSKINVIFATTDAYKVFKPLINRCEEVYLYTYSDKEISGILDMYIEDHIRVLMDPDSWSELRLACRGRARTTYLMAQRINRFCRTQSNYSLFNAEGWSRLKEIFGIYYLGLNRQELTLLSLIGKNEPVSAKALALKLMVNQKNIEDELEIRLKELDLVKNTTRGRVLTDQGLEYIATYSV